VEEFVFYFTGFLTILLLYIWCDLYWLRLYHVEDDGERGTPVAVRLHPKSAVLGFVLITVSIIYKKYGPHPYHEGFPGYLVFLVLFAVLPSIMFFETTRRLINWRAFSMSLFLVLLVSLLWEGTLGVPYAWWGYQMKAMMGVTVDAWANLPIEAIILWVAVTWTTVIVYELTSMYFHARKPATDSGPGSSVLK
jgi:hypothetical protein